jgi:predicted amidohydrolase YtcJ
MIGDQAARTPNGQWVQVMGGRSPYQFAERRMPTPSELTAAAHDVPVLVLYGYSQVTLNSAGVRSLDLSQGSPTPADSSYEFVDGGTVVRGNTAVYATIAGLPTLSDEQDRLSSTERFFRELNRFGITSVVDPGESATRYPEDYEAVATLAQETAFLMRLSNFLFAQQPSRGRLAEVVALVEILDEAQVRGLPPQPRRSPGRDARALLFWSS